VHNLLSKLFFKKESIMGKTVRKIPDGDGITSDDKPPIHIGGGSGDITTDGITKMHLVDKRPKAITPSDKKPRY
jgi:hypothetical protein